MYVPDKVKKYLRAEVGFGCPVEGCGSPYLTYHHFDPPRREREHNEPSGMIALCRSHHDDAEGGAYTKDQLRALKEEGAERNKKIEGDFQWRRQQLLIHIGQTLTFESPIPLAFNGIPVVSLTRDENNYVLVSINMLTTSVLPRLRMFENDWVSAGNPTDLEAPPYGRKLSASYPNGDAIRIEFRSIADPDELTLALPAMSKAKDWATDLTNDTGVDSPQLTFPAVLVDVELELPDADISINSEGIKIGMSEMSGSYGAYGPYAVSLGHIPAPFPTMMNAVGISRDRPLLRFASMNDDILWNVADRKFKRGVFLLDGFEFDSCNFEECVFAMRGQPFLLKNNQLGIVTMMKPTEIQNSYNIIKYLAENGFPDFVNAAERLGQVAAEQRQKNKA